jgi:hypothetical protein
MVMFMAMLFMIVIIIILTSLACLVQGANLIS